MSPSPTMGYLRQVNSQRVGAFSADNMLKGHGLVSATPPPLVDTITTETTQEASPA